MGRPPLSPWRCLGVSKPGCLRALNTRAKDLAHSERLVLTWTRAKHVSDRWSPRPYEKLAEVCFRFPSFPKEVQHWRGTFNSGSDWCFPRTGRFPTIAKVPCFRPLGYNSPTEKEGIPMKETFMCDVGIVRIYPDWNKSELLN